MAAGWIISGLIIYSFLFARRVSIADVPKTILTSELLDLKKAKRYKTLVPIANPERARRLVELAGRIARGCRGDVLALTVMDLPDVSGYSEAEPFIGEAQRVLNRAQRIAVQQKLPLSSLLKIGRSASHEIVQVAIENRCDLILLGYKKEEDPLENSVIHRVISHQPCDMAILKSDNVSVNTFHRILIPIAGREVHDQLKVRLVHCLYQEESSRITLMTVIPPGSSAARRQAAMVMPKRATQIYQIPEANLAVDEHAQAAQAIIARAADHDLMVLGMREEPWFKSFFFGTLAQQVAGQVQSATLLTKAWSPRKTRVKRIIGVRPK